MCGILGSINIKLDFETLSTIEHRGPDDYGVLELLIKDHEIFLGHRRLAIVDLSAAGLTLVPLL